MQDDIDPATGLKKIYKASAQGMQDDAREHYKAKYPWDLIAVGECFSIKPEEMKLTTLRPYAVRMGTKLNKRFKVTNHGTHGYEVSRLTDKAMTPEELAKTSQTTGKSIWELNSNMSITNSEGKINFGPRKSKAKVSLAPVKGIDSEE